MFLAVLNALIALPKLLGYAELAFKAVQAVMRKMELEREKQRTQLSDTEIKAAIAASREGIETLNAKWNGD